MNRKVMKMSRVYKTFEPDNIKEVDGGYCVQFRNGSNPLDIIFKKETLGKIANMFYDERLSSFVGELENIEKQVVDAQGWGNTPVVELVDLEIVIEKYKETI